MAVTLVVVAAALLFGAALWQSYRYDPWTRDGRVRAEVVRIAPQVAGPVQTLDVLDNQFVHKGDLLFTIDPARYQLAVASAQASLETAQHDFAIKTAQSRRREKLSDLAASSEDKQVYAAQAAMAGSAVAAAQASLDLAKLNLSYTTVRSPVNGYITNLKLQAGDYAAVGANIVSLVDSDSFWIVGYFEETKLPLIETGMPATVKLMGVNKPLTAHVDSIARGITDDNGTTGDAGLASVNPTFTWVRLAQRIPVRLAIDSVPDGVVIAAGQSCTIEVGDERPTLKERIDRILGSVAGRVEKEI